MLGLGLGKFGKGVKSGIAKLLNSLKRRAEYFENKNDSKSEIKVLKDYELLDKASILLTPTATSDARVHSVKTYTGDELVTNGGFDTDSDWSKSEGWTIVNGKATHDGLSSYKKISQLITTVVGNTYRYEVTVSDLTTHQVYLMARQNNEFGTYYFNNIKTENGTYVFYFTALTTLTAIVFQNGNSNEVSIDNSSVVDVSSDFDFDRASSATRINSDGLVQDMQSITDPELVLNGDFEELGDNVLLGNNFTFDSGVGDWEVYTNATLAHDTDKLEVTLASGGGAKINTNSLFTGGQAGKILKIRARIWQGTTTHSSIAIYVGSAQETVSISSTPTYFEVYLKPTSTGYLTIYTSSGDGTFFIDNISVQQVDPNDRWSLVGDFEIDDTKGFITSASQYSQITSQQGVNFLDNGKTYKLEADITTSIDNALAYRVTGGAVTPISFSDIVDGKYVSYFTMSQDGYFWFQTTGSYTGLNATIDNVSVKDITFSTDVDLARINYDSNGDNGHILLEPTSTNLITYSEDFTDSSWDLDFSAPYITRTPDAATSPSGENNATKLIGNDVSRDPTNSYIGASTSASAPYTASIFAKKGEYDYLALGVGSYAGGYYAIFNLSNGTISTSPTASGTTASIEDYGNGWFRCIITTTNTSGSEILFTTPSVDGTLTTDYTSTTNGVYVWGAQLENLSHSTSYIPNHGTAAGVTRAAETLNGSGNSTLINTTKGTLYLESKLGGLTGTKVFSIGGGTNNADPAIVMGYSNQNMYIDIQDGGSLISTSSDKTISGINTSSYNKMAIKYTTTNVTVYLNGVKKHTETIDFTPATNVIKSLYGGYSAGSKFEGAVKALAVFNEALEDDELELLTGVTNYGSFSELASANGYTII
jgi:hypothetical protein